MTESLFYRPLLVLSVLLAAVVGGAAAQGRAAAVPTVRGGDHIAVIVNQELVTAGEVERRLDALKPRRRGGAAAEPISSPAARRADR